MSAEHPEPGRAPRKARAALPHAAAGGPLPSARVGERRPAAPHFNWTRFWVRAILAMLAFNVLAALLTVYVIFPWLHPTR